MPTPKSWIEAAKRALERQNAPETPETAENADIRPQTPENARIPPTTPGVGIGGYWEADPEGVIRDVRLMEVSLVREPADPSCRIISIDGEPV